MIQNDDDVLKLVREGGWQNVLEFYEMQIEKETGNDPEVGAKESHEPKEERPPAKPKEENRCYRELKESGDCICDWILQALEILLWALLYVILMAIPIGVFCGGLVLIVGKTGKKKEDEIRTFLGGFLLFIGSVLLICTFSCVGRPQPLR